MNLNLVRAILLTYIGFRKISLFKLTFYAGFCLMFPRRNFLRKGSLIHQNGFFLLAQNIELIIAQRIQIIIKSFFH